MMNFITAPARNVILTHHRETTGSLSSLAMPDYSNSCWLLILLIIVIHFASTFCNLAPMQRVYHVTSLVMSV